MTATMEARKAERERIKSILTSEAATGRDKLAQHLAFETDNDVEAAESLLKASNADAGESPLDRAMSGIDGPLIRSVETDGGDQPRADANALSPSKVYGKFNSAYFPGQTQGKN